MRTAVDLPVPLSPTTRAYWAVLSGRRSTARSAMSDEHRPRHGCERVVGVELDVPRQRGRPQSWQHGRRQPLLRAANLERRGHAPNDGSLTQKEVVRDDETEDKHEPLNDIREQTPNAGVCDGRDMRRRGGGGGGRSGRGGRAMARWHGVWGWGMLRRKARCGGGGGGLYPLTRTQCVKSFRRTGQREEVSEPLLPGAWQLSAV